MLTQLDAGRTCSSTSAARVPAIWESFIVYIDSIKAQGKDVLDGTFIDWSCADSREDHFNEKQALKQN